MLPPLVPEPTLLRRGRRLLFGGCVTPRTLWVSSPRVPSAHHRHTIGTYLYEASAHRPQRFRRPRRLCVSGRPRPARGQWLRLHQSYRHGSRPGDTSPPQQRDEDTTVAPNDDTAPDTTTAPSPD
jgi:hypothetical protein